MITIEDIYLHKLAKRLGASPIRAWRLDDGDVFAVVSEVPVDGSCNGALWVATASSTVSMADFAESSDQFRIILQPALERKASDDSPEQFSWNISGYVCGNAGWQKDEVLKIPVTCKADPRVRGILETDVLKDKMGVFFGLGSMGGTIAVEFGKCGLGRGKFIDYQRLEPGNVNRHVGGRKSVGRRKTAVIADAYMDRNPLARAQTFEMRIGPEHLEAVRSLVRDAHIVICAMDDRIAREVVNQACVLEGKTVVFVSAFRRAYGGQVLRVRPHQGPCYLCFVLQMLASANDVEISNQDQADQTAYADRPVHIEPGLHNDIVPICSMAVKLGLQVLLAGLPTTLRSLDEDLTTDWYIFVNRREADTPYSHLTPLGNGVDGMRILRWYGVPLRRYDGCYACGNGDLGLMREYATEPSPCMSADPNFAEEENTV